MKILFINAFYREGSTGKIVYDIIQNLQGENGYEFLACYGRGQRQNDNRAYRICSELYAKFGILRGLVTGRYYSGQMLASEKLIKYIEAVHPDIIHIHCMNSYVMNIYRVLNYIKEKKYKTIITLHAEFMYTGTCGYAFECEKWKCVEGCTDCEQAKGLFPLIDSSAKNWRDMVNVFQNYDDLILTSVSPWLQKRAKESYILGKYKNTVILNGVDTKVFQYEKPCYTRAKKVVLHVTADFEKDIKGGRFVREIAKRYMEKGENDIEFIVVGKTNGTNVSNNITLLGPIYDQKKLANLYSEADITLLTSKKETFSMVCAESLCCGTPVVGFKAGAPEEISIAKYSEFVEQGNVELLMDAMERWLSKEINKSEVSEEASEVYSSRTMAYQYKAIYDTLMES